MLTQKWKSIVQVITSTTARKTIYIYIWPNANKKKKTRSKNKRKKLTWHRVSQSEEHWEGPPPPLDLIAPSNPIHPLILSWPLIKRVKHLTLWPDHRPKQTLQILTISWHSDFSNKFEMLVWNINLFFFIQKEK